MDPKHLIQLSVILDKGSLTAAAKHLLVAQPTLTRNMATLEMQAGTTLFHRSRFGVRSTPTGEALAREGRAIARNLQLALEQVSRFRIGLHDHLRVGVGPFIGIALMPALLKQLLHEIPRSSFTVSKQSPSQALDQLLDGDLDVVVGPAAHSRLLPGIQRLLLAEDRMGIFCGPSHPLAAKPCASVKDLQSADWLSLGFASIYQREITEMLTQRGITGIRTRVVTRGDASILIQLLRGGQHVAALPCLPVKLAAGMPPLHELQLADGPVLQRNLYLWCKEELIDTPLVGSFHQAALKLMQPFSTG